MEQKLLATLEGKIDQTHECCYLILCTFVQPDLADAQHVGPIEELG